MLNTQAGTNPHDIVLQVFPNASTASVRQTQERTLRDILSEIKAPQPTLRKTVSAIRGERDKDRRQALKKRLPAVCLSAVFRANSTRNRQSVERLTGLMQIDIDHAQDIEAAKDALKSLPYVLAVFRSPSGDGVKGVAWVAHTRTDAHLIPVLHAAAFEQISSDVKRLGYENDPSIKDTARACFLSHDPELWINDKPEPLAVKTQRQNLKKPKVSERTREQISAAALPSSAIVNAETLILERFKRGGKISDGRRNALYRVGLACRDAGLSLPGAIRIGEQVNAEICLPPKQSGEVAQQIRNAYQYAQMPFGNRAPELLSRIDAEKARTLSAKIDRTVCKRYLEPQDLRDMAAKVVLVESVQGTGKTECIKTLIAETVLSGGIVVYLAHRVSLLRQASEKFGLTFYKNAKGGGFSDSIAITPNSLPMLSRVLESYSGATIFIDEVDQVLKDMTGGTCQKDRQEIFATFHALLQRAGKIYGLSADITQNVHALFSEIGFSPAVLRNTHRTERKAVRYKSVLSIRADMERAMSAGEKVALACDSKKVALAIHRSIEKKFPEKACLLITEDNSRTDAVQALFKDTSGFQQFDCVIYSPSMGSGVDINIPFGGVQYLIARGGSVTGPELLQMATRFRQWGELHFYCTPARLKKPRSEIASEILAEWFRKENEYEGLFYFDNYTVEKKTLPGHEWAVNLASRVQAEVNASRNNLYERFAECLLAKGFVILERDETDSDAVKEIGGRDRESAAEIRAEYVAAVLDPANDISEFEAAQFERDGIERIKVDRFNYIKTIGTSDSETMAEAVKVSLRQRKKQVKAFSTFFDSPADLAQREKDRSGYLPDMRYEAMKATIRQRIESRAGLLSAPDSFRGYSKADTETLRQIIEENREQVSRYLFDVTEAMVESPILFLRSFYGQAGVRLKATARGKARTRFYTVDTDSLAFMRGIYERRQARAKAEAEARANPFDFLNSYIPAARAG